MRNSDYVMREFIANLSKGKKWFFAVFWLALAGFSGLDRLLHRPG